MSNPKSGFADDVKRFLAMFPSLAKYAEEVGKVGSLEQAAKEAEDRIARAKSEYEEKSAGLEAEHAVHLAHIDQAKRDAEVAKAEAGRIVDAARHEGDLIVDKAGEIAKQIEDNARAAAGTTQKVLDDLHAKIADAKNELEKLHQQQAHEDELLRSIAARKKQFQDSLNDLKARL